MESTKKYLSPLGSPFLWAGMIFLFLAFLVRSGGSLYCLFFSESMSTMLVAFAGLYAWIFQQKRLDANDEQAIITTGKIDEALTISKNANELAKEANGISKVQAGTIQAISDCSTFDVETRKSEKRVEIFKELWTFRGYYEEYLSDSLECELVKTLQPTDNISYIPVNYESYHRYMNAVVQYKLFFDFPEHIQSDLVLKIIDEIMFTQIPAFFRGFEDKRCDHYHLTDNTIEHFRKLNQFLIANARRVLYRQDPDSTYQFFTELNSHYKINIRKT